MSLDDRADLCAILAAECRLLFADHPVISSHEGKPTLMIRFANERHDIIGKRHRRLWLLKNVVSMEGQSLRRFYELPLVQNEHPALALSWNALP